MHKYIKYNNVYTPTTSTPRSVNPQIRYDASVKSRANNNIPVYEYVCIRS